MSDGFLLADELCAEFVRKTHCVWLETGLETVEHAWLRLFGMPIGPILLFSSCELDGKTMVVRLHEHARLVVADPFDGPKGRAQIRVLPHRAKELIGNMAEALASYDPLLARHQASGETPTQTLDAADHHARIGGAAIGFLVSP